MSELKGEPSNVEEPKQPPGTKPPTVTSTDNPSPVIAPDRNTIISTARTFLQSPQIRYQDESAKRRFLAEKGLSKSEINSLLNESPAQPPLVPPRAYPQPPPSGLPSLLLGIARIFSVVAGGTTILAFVYYRFLLPKIVQTFLARKSLKSHSLALLGKLTISLSSLKKAQGESFSVLPRPVPYKEPSQFSECQSVNDILKFVGETASDVGKISPISLLRCAIADFEKAQEGQGGSPTTEDIFRYLEGQIPRLITDEGMKVEQTLWDTLNNCPLFIGTPQTAQSSDPPAGEDSSNPTCWSYNAPTLPPPPPMIQSLDKLSSVMKKDFKPKNNPFQHTLQSLSDFTGYISTQVYLPYRPPVGAVGAPSTPQSPAEDELRREIRALKGLVLNRRSFMPTRYNSAPTRPPPP